MASKLDISKLNKKERIMLGLVVAIALLAGFYMLYYAPSEKKTVEIRKEIEVKEKALQTARMHAGLFNPLKKKVEEMEARLKLLKVRIAAKEDAIALIKTIEDEAQRLKMKVINMYANVQEPPPPQTEEEKKPGEVVTPLPGYTKVVLDISLRGKYKQLEELLETIQNRNTFITIETLDISSDETIYPGLASNVKIGLFVEKGAVNDAIVK